MPEDGQLAHDFLEVGKASKILTVSKFTEKTFYASLFSLDKFIRLSLTGQRRFVSEKIRLEAIFVEVVC
jgi:hypothetical protein